MTLPVLPRVQAARVAAAAIRPTPILIIEQACHRRADVRVRVRVRLENNERSSSSREGRFSGLCPPGRVMRDGKIALWEAA